MHPGETPLQQVIELASAHADVSALWLYGSRARGDNRADSDYDLAVTFRDHTGSRLAQASRIEALRSSFATVLDAEVSLVDLEVTSTPLAAQITEEGILLLDRTPVETGWLYQKIWSKWDDWQFNRTANLSP